MRESKILLCKNIKLDKNYNNVLNYSENDLLTLCSDSTHLISQKNDYSFIRGNLNTISTNFTYSDALKSNYIAFQNKDYDNKWFFAFVNDVVYKSDSCTEIVFTIDYWSTWFNKLTLSNCYVKREHTNNDTIGANILDENLDIGDVICEHVDSIDLGSKLYLILETTYLPNDNSHQGDYEMYDEFSCHNGAISGNANALFLVNMSSASIDTDLQNIERFVKRANNDGHGEDLRNLYILPENLVGSYLNFEDRTAYVTDTDNLPFEYFLAPRTVSYEDIRFSQSKNLTFSDYTPKNNKLFCYPYNYLMVSNNCGNQNIYKYEDWTIDNNYYFMLAFTLVCGGSGRLFPLNFKGCNIYCDESLPLGKFPTSSFSGDAYINWLSQNSLNIATQIGLSAGNILSAGMIGNASQPLQLGKVEQATSEESRAMIQGQQNLSNVQNSTSMGTSIAGGILGVIGQFYSAKMLPNITGGQNTGDVDLYFNTFRFLKMRCKTENLKVIDDYFSKYGYKTNRVKTPNVTGRQNWNYIEIGADSSIGYGEIPQNALEVINTICKRGVTIWHNHNNIGNYSLSNNIVS